jgi:hypothetical protein
VVEDLSHVPLIDLEHGVPQASQRERLDFSRAAADIELHAHEIVNVEKKWKPMGAHGPE